MLKLAALLAVSAALFAPSLARAGDVTMQVQEIPLGGRALAAAPRPMHFNMLAAHWRGSGAVAYRVHRLHGRWGAWTGVETDGATGAWHDGGLDWTGAADAVQFRTSGRVTRLRAYELWSRVTSAAPARRLAEASSPPIVSRAEWGANEEIVRSAPLIARTLRVAFVHHTVGTNRYTRAQAPAIVRGIELYHVKGNGWNDIGYNFLVDRFGTVYEGRAGGIDQNVIGAHTQGFNTGSVGVALMGNYVAATPPKVQQDALVRLLAWRLDVGHLDPLSTVVETSGGNPKFRAGTVVTLRAISGHRDAYPTECPGAGVYRLLPSLARRVAATGLPKLYAPTVTGVLGGPIRFQARLSSALAWTVTIVDSTGAKVASGTGRGPILNWTWRSPLVESATYTWTMTAPGVLTATGKLGVPQPLAPPAQKFSLTNLAVHPSVITPAIDGTGDLATVSFTLGAPASVVVTVLDASLKPVLTVLDDLRPAGDNSFALEGHLLQDGRYTLAATATAGAKSVTKGATFVVDRTLSGLTLSSASFSPNGDGVDDAETFSFVMAQTASLRLDILQNGVVVATPFQGQLAAGPQSIVWDGTANGAPLPDGSYTAQFTVTDALGDVAVTAPIVISSG